MEDKNEHKPEQANTEDLKKGFQALVNYIKGVIQLDEGIDKLATIQEIKDKKSMAGANAWMLMCSIMIASVGLDVNSPAVIIGAMLISPLMSPILGIGLAVGINDKETLKASLFHFTAAIFIAIVTSTLYFILSPFGEITNEIAARIEPTFLDVIIAVFGGIAGFISIARKDLSTTLPGVAIATALMPPLCVTGFGIANWDWEIASHSFYLFFLNTVFVSLSTYMIIRLLDFPHRDYVNKQERRKAQLYLGLFAFLVIVPSFFIFKKVWVQIKNKIKLEHFVDDYLSEDKIYLDDYQLITSDSTNTVVLKVYGSQISDKRLPELEQGMREVGLSNTKLKIIPTSEIRLDELQNLERQVNGVSKIANQLKAATEIKENQSETISKLQKQLKNATIDTTDFIKLRNEIIAIIPEVKDVVFGYGQTFNDEKSEVGIPLVIIEWAKPVRNEKDYLERIGNYIKVNLDKEDCIVVSR